MEEEKKEIQKETKEKREKEKSVLGEIWEWTYCIFLAVVITLLVKNLIFSTTIVRKESMVPTLQDGNILIIERLAQVMGKPLNRGDIVVVEAPQQSTVAEDGMRYAYYPEDNVAQKFIKLFSKTLYIKRVIGLPGEHLVIDGDDIYINGEKLDEPYTNPDREKFPPEYDMDITIPEGYVFCVGDNRDRSMDSRYFGVIPIDKVEGKTSFRLFPFNKFGKIE
ncbi:MAG: signal peptidase I [Clostridia bacterium]|nr:signal peptidase I [Clostridia bacterium]